MIYELLPAEHRIRDAELGHPLRALLEPIEAEYQRLRSGIDGRYADLFVETCSAEVLPLIGALLAVDDGGVVARGSVANAVRVRRAEGTAAGLARAVRDATGWAAHVVESLPLLASTQHVNYRRPAAVRTPDVRDPDRGGPSFRSVAVRGPYRPDHVQVHVHRIEAQPACGLRPGAVSDRPWAWTFDPAGRDRQLYVRADPPIPLDHRTLRRLARAGELDTALRIVLQDGPVAMARVRSADLGTWVRPADDTVAVDPVRGRFALGSAVTKLGGIRVDVAFGGAGDIGAGPGEHRALLAAADAPLPTSPEWQFVVADGRTLTDAVSAWDARAGTAPGTTGVIRILDSVTQPGPVAFTAAAGEHLIVVAADGACPYVDGGVTVTGDVVLAGLRVRGAVAVSDKGAPSLVLVGCTVGGVTVGATRTRLHRCVTSALSVPAGVRCALSISESVVQSSGIDAPAADVVLDAVTLFGSLSARTLTATDSILLEPPNLGGPGTLSHSYAPPGGGTLRRAHCRPEGDPSAVPRFASTAPDDPAFGQLSPVCPDSIARGARDGEEMGAYRFLRRPAGLDHLRAQFDRHLRLGLTADVTFAT
ncbi:hypothetical protein [Cryptosporangium sp. NPDC048952]|uniref:hypothetical protein n=1 Tax=Cryptosporangium sp. NPDC048952 TaxID=3363961 RepID=UPI0037218BCD